MGTVTGMTSIVILATSLLATSAWADPLDWYRQQLFEPSRTQLAMEKSGRIMIYNGLHDRDVQRALDEQFDRVESMMFTGTIVTDERGEPAINRETGEVLVENDGCD